MEVPASACSLVKAEAVNKVTNVENEAWDIADEVVPGTVPVVASSNSTDTKEKASASPNRGKKGATTSRSAAPSAAPKAGKKKGSKGAVEEEDGATKGKASKKRKSEAVNGMIKDSKKAKTSGPKQGVAVVKVKVGNTHRLLHRKKVETDQGEMAPMHKWTAFVRGDRTAESHIAKVVFHLHPSFKPAVVTIKKPPFEVTEMGWGTFSIDVDIHHSTGQITRTEVPLDFERSMSASVLKLPVS